MEKKEHIKLTVWGTGGMAANTLSYNEAWLRDVDIVCFVSNSHEEGEEELFGGKRVVSPAELSGMDYDYIIIFSTYEEEIREQMLHGLNVPAEKILSLEELAGKAMEWHQSSMIGKDVLLYGGNYHTDNYLYHIGKRAKRLRIIADGEQGTDYGIETVDIRKVKDTAFDYILLFGADREEEEKLAGQIRENGFTEDGRILGMGQWCCSLALEHRITHKEGGETYYAIVGRPTWGLMALFTEFMRAAAHAIRQGYIPFIDMQSSMNMYLEEKDLGRKNAWEAYFTQPDAASGKRIEEIYEKENVVVPSKFFRVKTDRDVVKDSKALANLKEVYHGQFRMADDALGKIIPEYQRVFGKAEGHRVLGAIFRGTDYKNIKPANHFVQPELGEFIERCRECMKEWECQYLFVATEDADILDSLKEAFGEKLLYTNQLRYRNTGDRFLYEIANQREDDRYLRGLEYLTALYCLTKCQCLASGRNAGLNGTLIMKEGEFEKLYVFQKGKYSPDSRSFNRTAY